jgi:hypothetical protein
MRVPAAAQITKDIPLLPHAQIDQDILLLSTLLRKRRIIPS